MSESTIVEGAAKPDYYEVRITMTRKNIDEEDYQTFDYEEKVFQEKESAIEFLQKKYDKEREKSEMYRDTKDRGTVQVGWIYKFENRDWSHDGEPWDQADWVQVYAIHASVVLA